MASFVTTMRDTPLWTEWRVELVATHREGPVLSRALAFVHGLTRYLCVLVSRRPDLVHLHTAKNGSFTRKAVLLWLARAARVPAILHVHDGEFRAFYDRSPRVGRWIIRRTLARAGAVVALGEGWARRLREIVPEARYAAIPNAVRIVGPSPRARDGEQVRVVFLGRIDDAKGAFTLLDAWARAVPSMPAERARLTIAGHGEVERARAVVADNDLGESVELLPWQSAAQVAELLAGAHVLTLPSRSEGLPMVVLEAMARGLCVVASRVGGIPDLVEDGTSGVLVPADDVEALAAALGTVITDSRIRNRLGDAALDRARREFDVDTVWRRFDALYREVSRKPAGLTGSARR